jgi:hypothetical protein
MMLVVDPHQAVVLGLVLDGGDRGERGVALGPGRQQMEEPARALPPTRKTSDRGRPPGPRTSVAGFDARRREVVVDPLPPRLPGTRASAAGLPLPR